MLSHPSEFKVVAYEADALFRCFFRIDSHPSSSLAEISSSPSSKESTANNGSNIRIMAIDSSTTEASRSGGIELPKRSSSSNTQYSDTVSHGLLLDKLSVLACFRRGIEPRELLRSVYTSEYLSTEFYNYKIEEARAENEEEVNKDIYSINEGCLSRRTHDGNLHQQKYHNNCNKGTVKYMELYSIYEQAAEARRCNRINMAIAERREICKILLLKHRERIKIIKQMEETNRATSPQLRLSREEKILRTQLSRLKLPMYVSDIIPRSDTHCNIIMTPPTEANGDIYTCLGDGHCPREYRGEEENGYVCHKTHVASGDDLDRGKQDDIACKCSEQEAAAIQSLMAIQTTTMASPEVFKKKKKLNNINKQEKQDVESMQERQILSMLRVVRCDQYRGYRRYLDKYIQEREEQHKMADEKRKHILNEKVVKANGDRVQKLMKREAKNSKIANEKKTILAQKNIDMNEHLRRIEEEKKDIRKAHNAALEQRMSHVQTRIKAREIEIEERRQLLHQMNTERMKLHTSRVNNLCAKRALIRDIMSKRAAVRHHSAVRYQQSVKGQIRHKQHIQEIKEMERCRGRSPCRHETISCGRGAALSGVSNSNSNNVSIGVKEGLTQRRIRKKQENDNVWEEWLLALDAQWERQNKHIDEVKKAKYEHVLLSQMFTKMKEESHRENIVRIQRSNGFKHKTTKATEHINRINK